MKTKQNNPTRIFRTVDCADRLPQKEGRYLVLNQGQWHEADYSERYSFHEEMSDCSGVTHWMEEITLPTEEEVYAEAGKKSTRTYLAFMHGASFILNHIKGGTNNED